MAIDVLSDDVVTLAQAAKLLPKRRGNKRPHVSCVYRWTTSGCKGVTLESVQVGGTRCTSRQALARFFERLSQVKHGVPRSVASSVSRRRIEEASQRLRDFGV